MLTHLMGKKQAKTQELCFHRNWKLIVDAIYTNKMLTYMYTVVCKKHIHAGFAVNVHMHAYVP